MPLLILSLLLVPILLIPNLVDLPPAAHSALTVADWAIWFVFFAEFVTRFSLAVEHWRYVREHLLDLAFVALPTLRPRYWLPSCESHRVGIGHLAVTYAALIGRGLVVCRARFPHGLDPFREGHQRGGLDRLDGTCG
jgi:hypothetical protein